MIEYLPLIIDLAIAIIAIFWIQTDMDKKGIERKFYWLWMVGVVGGLLLFGIVGIVIVLVAYYLWSRKARE